MDPFAHPLLVFWLPALFGLSLFAWCLTSDPYYLYHVYGSGVLLVVFLEVYLLSHREPWS